MNRIVQLPEHLKNMIAAGEVIEGPFSVVKELVENSIDAGATEIDVQVSDSGLKRIFVRDNGSGINREDAALSIKEHATSKIRDITGLQSIATYGFRGEALSSICSISDFILLTRTADEETGARLESVNGNVSITDYAGSSGTTVIVDNLFFNMPARKKFLKTKKTELRSIRETMLKISLAVPHVAFSFDVDGKRQITLQSVQQKRDRVRQVFGAAIYDSLYYEELTDLKVRISGFLSKPDYMRNTKSMQFLYVNGRPVEHKYLSYHLTRAYDAVMPGGKYPAAIIFIEIDPELTDVNIHPAKREVKLFDQKYIDSLIYSLASKALNRAHSFPEKLFTEPVKKADEMTAPLSFRDASAVSTPPQIYMTRESGEIETDKSMAGSLLFDSAEDIRQAEPPIINEIAGQKIIGVIFDTYLLVEEDGKVHFIDFHAAHERMLFDKFKECRDIEIQELLFPVQIELSKADFALAVDNADLFSSSGFEIEEFSDTSIIVRSAPSSVGNYKIDELVKNMIDNIRDEKDSNKLNDNIIALMACHSAKRSGDRLSSSDMNALAAAVFSGEIELRCPHGRPFLFTLNKNDIERMFKRL